MASLLRMIEVAANATHATLASWSKQVGDPIAVGDCLAEVETDKAIVEITADDAGVMGSLLVRAGQEVEVGAPIAVLLAKGETRADEDALLQRVAPVPVASPTHAEAAVLSADRKEEAVAPTAESTRVRASPLARRLSAQLGVDLSTLQGSGPGGRIVKRDVERAQQRAPSAAAATAAPTATYAEVPHSTMRRTIARRLSESKSTIPHFYLSTHCRMDRLLALRANINKMGETKISVNDFVVRAVALALRDVPNANVGWTDAAMRHYQQADVAVAVATDAGLITPIVHAAERKSLAQISAEIAELATRARAGQLRPDEYQGGSFSVSNLGMYGVSEFSAIINPPQAAILAVGAAQPQPIVKKGKIKVGTVMTCTLSVDHRAIDGAVAAQWLAAFRHHIETPLSLLV